MVISYCKFLKTNNKKHVNKIKLFLGKTLDTIVIQ